MPSLVPRSAPVPSLAFSGVPIPSPQSLVVDTPATQGALLEGLQTGVELGLTPLNIATKIATGKEALTKAKLGPETRKSKAAKEALEQKKLQSEINKLESEAEKNRRGEGVKIMTPDQVEDNARLMTDLISKQENKNRVDFQKLMENTNQIYKGQVLVTQDEMDDNPQWENETVNPPGFQGFKRIPKYVVHGAVPEKPDIDKIFKEQKRRLMREVQEPFRAVSPPNVIRDPETEQDVAAPILGAASIPTTPQTNMISLADVRAAGSPAVSTTPLSLSPASQFAGGIPQDLQTVQPDLFPAQPAQAPEETEQVNVVSTEIKKVLGDGNVLPAGQPDARPMTIAKLVLRMPNAQKMREAVKSLPKPFDSRVTEILRAMASKE